MALVCIDDNEVVKIAGEVDEDHFYDPFAKEDLFRATRYDPDGRPLRDADGYPFPTGPTEIKYFLHNHHAQDWILGRLDLSNVETPDPAHHFALFFKVQTPDSNTSRSSTSAEQTVGTVTYHPKQEVYEAVRFEQDGSTQVECFAKRGRAIAWVVRIIDILDEATPLANQNAQPSISINIKL